ncbi:uncharacterized protein C3orf14 homolog isoform X2 [Scophthalmus maximus]|uniref:uncharacterized protein C3orf14 homolog isoform X2 n=1 Tax=Scophthalmus maximus TaxID=52904 RepID=UPI0015E0D9F3|nr:uncharacterized protein C3orf14 homolog isoform X2 [Scophthalmus maximus]
MELCEKHEEILGRRAELLEQMESRREQLTGLRRQRAKEGEAARRRNAALLQCQHREKQTQHLPSVTAGLTEDRRWSPGETAATPTSSGSGDKVLGVCGRVHPSLGALPRGQRSTPD